MNNGRPQKYQELAERIRDMIVSCRLRRGDMLPPERKFAEMLNCSHLTLRKALQVLEKNNLIHAIPSRGRFVGPRPRDAAKPAAIALLLPNSDPFYFSILALLENRLYHQNLHLTVHISNGSHAKENDILQKIGEQGFAALVAVPNPLCLEAYSKLQLPVTFFDYNIHNVNIPSVVCDEYAGSCAAVDYLVRIGCRNIAYIGGLYSPTSEDRLQGCLDRLAKYELPIRQAWIIRDIPTREAGESAARMLFESGDPVPDAFLCNNDAVAAGVIRYFSQSGRPPCPLVGFGNTSRAEELGICSVEQHVDRIADMILRNLQMQFSGEKPPLKTVIPTNLIVR